MKKPKVPDIKSPDAFQAIGQTIVKALAERAALIAGVLTTLLVTLVAVFGFQYWQKREEAKALEAIAKAERPIEQKREALTKPEDSERDKKDSEMAMPRTLDPKKFNEDFSELSRNLEGVILEHKGKDAAQVAAIRLAGFYLSQEQYERAESLLAQMQTNKKGSLLDNLLQFQKASVYMSKEAFDRAAPLFEELIDAKSAEYLHAEALVRLGLCYQNLNQLDRAKDAYTRASTEFSDSQAGRAAKSFLRLLLIESTKSKALEKSAG